MTGVTALRVPAPTTARGGLLIPSAATLLVLMNYTAPMSTLAVTAGGLRAGPGAQVWLLSGISLGLAAALSPAGSLADSYGRKRLFVAGGALLTLASVACGLAASGPVFVAGRIAQGAASAALLATALGIIGHRYPAGPPRVRATGIWGAMLGAGIALGPVVSASLATAAGWRAWYWLTVLASGALTVAAAATLTDSRAPRRRRLDVPGALALTGGVAALMSAVTLGRAGWTQPSVLMLTGLAAVLGCCYLLAARRPDAMLELSLFRRRDFAAATLGALFTGLAVIGIMSYLATVLEDVLGLTPLGSALLFGLWSGLSFLVALQARRLAGRLSARGQLAAGLLLSSLGEFGLLVLAPGGGWVRLIHGLAVAGAGSGLANAALARLAVDSVPSDRTSMGSAANNTARYLGASLGVALVVTIASRTAGAPGQPASAVHGATAAIAVSALLALIAAVAVALLRGPAAGPKVPGGGPNCSHRRAGAGGTLAGRAE